MIHPERIINLNEKKISKGKYVLYWMQQSQRVEYNHALEYAIECANRSSIPLVVFLGITTSYLEAQERHYKFMLDGLKEVSIELEKRNIKFVLQYISPEIGILKLSEKALLLVTDRGYLTIQRNWRSHVANKIKCPVFQVESDVIVPIETASEKEEYMARTLRLKLNKILPSYLVPLKKKKLKKSSLNLKFDSIKINDTDEILKELNIKGDVPGISWIKGGTANAKKILQQFISEKLKYFDTLRNDPSREYLSCMSPYLHFGQISPLFIALEIMKTNYSSKEVYLEEMIVRRELSMNFVYYNNKYDQFQSLPGWAQNTLDDHRHDRRKYIYTLDEMESSMTHDPYWNAAQREMVIKGKMHGYMRMYWGKKIIEWTQDPEEAYKRAIYLNNKYSLDGRDANGYTGVAWCFGKHDRAWKERPIFGKIRYMNSNGLERKFDINKYVERVKEIEPNNNL